MKKTLFTTACFLVFGALQVNAQFPPPPPPPLPELSEEELAAKKLKEASKYNNVTDIIPNITLQGGNSSLFKLLPQPVGVSEYRQSDMVITPLTENFRVYPHDEHHYVVDDSYFYGEEVAFRISIKGTDKYKDFSFKYKLLDETGTYYTIQMTHGAKGADGRDGINPEDPNGKGGYGPTKKEDKNGLDGSNGEDGHDAGEWDVFVDLIDLRHYPGEQALVAKFVCKGNNDLNFIRGINITSKYILDVKINAGDAGAGGNGGNPALACKPCYFEEVGIPGGAGAPGKPGDAARITVHLDPEAAAYKNLLTISTKAGDYALRGREGDANNSKNCKTCYYMDSHWTGTIEYKNTEPFWGEIEWIEEDVELDLEFKDRGE